jgi:hypothetical protein
MPEIAVLARTAVAAQIGRVFQPVRFGRAE